MKIIQSAASVLLISFLSLTANAMSITYQINLTIGAGSVSGYLTTDGTIADGLPISNSNILSWDLELNDGVDTWSLSNANSFLSGSVAGLTAFGSELYFNYDGNHDGDGLNILRIEQTADEQLGWQFAILQSNFYEGGIAQLHHQIQDLNTGLITLNHRVGVEVQGLQVIATAVQPPIGLSEPGTLGLMGLGFAVVGLARKCKQR